MSHQTYITRGTIEALGFEWFANRGMIKCYSRGLTVLELFPLLNTVHVYKTEHESESKKRIGVAKTIEELNELL